MRATIENFDKIVSIILISLIPLLQYLFMRIYMRIARITIEKLNKPFRNTSIDDLIKALGVCLLVIMIGALIFIGTFLIGLGKFKEYRDGRNFFIYTPAFENHKMIMKSQGHFYIKESDGKEKVIENAEDVKESSKTERVIVLSDIEKGHGLVVLSSDLDKLKLKIKDKNDVSYALGDKDFEKQMLITDIYYDDKVEFKDVRIENEPILNDKGAEIDFKTLSYYQSNSIYSFVLTILEVIVIISLAVGYRRRIRRKKEFVTTNIEETSLGKAIKIDKEDKGEK